MMKPKEGIKPNTVAAQTKALFQIQSDFCCWMITHYFTNLSCLASIPNVFMKKLASAIETKDNAATSLNQTNFSAIE